MMIVRHCALRIWDRIPVRALKGLIYRADISLDVSVTVTDSNKPNQTSLSPAQQYARTRPETTSFNLIS